MPVQLVHPLIVASIRFPIFPRCINNLRTNPNTRPNSIGIAARITPVINPVFMTKVTRRRLLQTMFVVIASEIGAYHALGHPVC